MAKAENNSIMDSRQPYLRSVDHGGKVVIWYPIRMNPHGGTG